MSDPETRSIQDGLSAEAEKNRLAAGFQAAALRPRMMKLLDETGVIQRVNLGKIVRWHPSPLDEDPVLVIHMDDGDRLCFPDPQHLVDDALCRAFYDLTAADLT